MRLNFVMSGVATGLRRNLSMTIALVLSTAISLGFLGAALVASTFIGDFRKQYENSLSVTIYLCPSIDVGSGGTDDVSSCNGRYTDAQQQQLEQRLRSDKRIASFSFFNEQQSYERAKANLPPATAENLEVGVIPALFQLKLRNIQQDYDGVRQTYAKAPGVQQIQNQSDELRTLLNLFSQVRTASFVVALVVLISAIILMANTIQVAAQHRRNETSIMRLVGASRWVTQLPFIIEAVVAAVVGGVIGTGLVFIGRQLFFYRVFGDQVRSGVFPAIDVSTVLGWGALGVGVGVVLASITAYGTLRLAVKL